MARGGAGLVANVLVSKCRLRRLAEFHRTQSVL